MVAESRLRNAVSQWTTPGSMMRRRTSNRKTKSKLCCAVSFFLAFFLIFATPGLENNKNYQTSVEYAAALDHGEEVADSCRGKRIYTYDLPPEFNVVVHNRNRCNHSLIPYEDLCPRFGNGGYGARLPKPRSSRKKAAYSRFGSGELFDQSDFYDTDSYTLEIIFRTRMRKYRCLTNETARADAFYVPFYTGLLMLDYLYGTEREIEKRKTYGMDFMAWMDENAGEPWRKRGARDHFMIMGRTTWDFTIHEAWGTDFAALPYVSNMTNLLFETRGLENEQAIPYPTSFHPRSPERLRDWIENVKTTRRKYLFSYIGSPRPNNLTIRGVLSSSCNRAGPLVCNLVDCSVVKCKVDPLPIYTSFLQSTFCLQPKGDTHTRRSTFDCIIAGAIPVFFSRYAAYTQYTWHLPQDRESYSVYITEEDLKRGRSIHAVLASYSSETIRRMRRTIVSIIPNLMYNAFENDDQSSAPKDAFELSIEKVLARIARLNKEERHAPDLQMIDGA